jgi:hypothetical protein
MKRWLAVVIACAAAAPARADERCPAAEFLPQLTIDKINEPVIPVFDNWQIFWGNVPMSDAQVALLAGDDSFIDRTNAEMQSRGSWVYTGMMMAAGGTALSSAGWVLYGQNKLPQGATLSLALGGLALGVAGLITITEFVQTPLEPHLAPTPTHRLTRDEARELVSRINDRMYREICEAAGAASTRNERAVKPPQVASQQ